MKVTVSRNELLAALLFASQDETRYTLSGVCIESTPKKQPRVIATDGRRLVVIESQAEQKEPDQKGSELLLRADFIKSICSLSKAIGGKLFPWVQFTHKEGSKQLFAEIIGGGCTVDTESNALIEGTYPDWRGALPPKDKSIRKGITDLGLNSEFLGDFAKAAKIMEASSPVVQMSLVGKNSAVEVKIPSLSNFYGLVMQCEADEEIEYQPEFVSIVKDFPKAEEPPKEETENQ